MEVVLDSPTVASIATELVAAARRGDRDAFRRLVEPELGRALGLATMLTRSSADGADAVQDALLSSWRGLDSLRDPQAFPAWFRRQLVRAALRSATRNRHVVELDVAVRESTDDIDRAFEQRQLLRAFDRLEPKDRLVLALHYFWDLPTAETADHLKVPVGTVKSRVHYALERLRAAYEAEERR